jgi:lipopolysaccharide heptosyltransferase II
MIGPALKSDSREKAPDPSDVRNILVKKFGGIGNVIMGTPMVEMLGAAFPSARITVVVQSEVAGQVLSGLPFVHDVVVLPFEQYRALGRARFLIEIVRWALRIRLGRYDLVVNSYGGYGGSSWLSVLLAWLMGGRYRIGYARAPWNLLYSQSLVPEGEIHEVLRNVALVDLVAPGSGKSELRLRFNISESGKSRAAELLAGWGISDSDLIVGMHPGCGPLTFKRWSPERFGDLADRLAAQRGLKVILFGGPEETDLADSIVSGMASSPVNAVGKTSLELAAALISRCQTFVSNDTGLMHLAAAVGVPVVAIFGPTNYHRTSPYGTGHTVLRSGLECLPCYRGRGAACDEFRCLDRISVDEVLQAVISKL